MAETKLLPGPYEYLELADGESLRLAITRSEEGEAVIHPRYPGAPEEKRVPCLRLYVAEGYKPAGAPYWDVTSKTLIARIRPHLAELAAEKKEFVLTAHGTGPRKRYTLEI